MTRLALAAVVAALALPVAGTPALAGGISIDLPHLTFPAPKPKPVLSSMGCKRTPDAQVCIAQG